MNERVIALINGLKGTVQPIERIFSAPAFGNIDSNRWEKCRRAFRAGNKESAHIGPQDTAIFAPITLLQMIGLASAHFEILESHVGERTVVLVGDIRRGQPL